MNSLVTILGSVSGATVFVTALVVLMRGIFGQVHATEDNTKALQDLQRSMMRLDGKLDSHEQRISRLEGRRDVMRHERRIADLEEHDQ